jgi:hypothetical protein
MYRFLAAVCGLSALLSASNFSFAQASINEGLETAFIYVDGTNGSDSNNGSKSSPLKTIGAAASMAEGNNVAGIGSRVIINPGTYRESLVLYNSQQSTSLPITFQAATNGTVIVSGSTLYTGWVKYSGNSNIYTNSWLNDWGTCAQITVCPYQQEIMMRQEMVAVNGQPLTQVLTLGQMQQGTFFVDQNASLIYVWPRNGTNMTTAAVDVASEPTILSVHDATNLVFRGLTFQYANSCRSHAAVDVRGNSSNILFDTDVFQWNNAQGLNISYPTTNFTVQNSTARHNGETGFQDEQTLNGWWQSNTASYSNWRGAQAAFYGCNTAGYHASLDHNDTVTGMTSEFNETWGIHWDTDNANITASGLIATGNYLAGGFAEKDEGPINISQSYFCNQNSIAGQGGFAVRNSEQVSISNSVLMGNVPAQIVVYGQAGGIEVTNWQTGVTTNLVTQNFTNHANVIQGNSTSQYLFDDLYLGGSDWTSFQNTLTSSRNTWWNPVNSTTEFIVPTPKRNTQDSFAGWQSLTLSDMTSTFALPSGNPGAACQLTPAGTDFWFTISSPLLTVNPGASAIYTLSLIPLNFTGTANLTLDGISEVPGLSATLSASSIKATGTATLTVTAASTTAPGTYSITIIANSGAITRTVTTQLTVN